MILWSVLCGLWDTRACGLSLATPTHPTVPSAKFETPVIQVQEQTSGRPDLEWG